MRVRVTVHAHRRRAAKKHVRFSAVWGGSYRMRFWDFSLNTSVLFAICSYTERLSLLPSGKAIFPRTMRVVGFLLSHRHAWTSWQRL